MKAIILCAGEGRRLGNLTENIPKPMVGIGGKPVLEHLILLCKKNEIEDIFLDTFYLSDVIKKYFGDGSKLGVKIKYPFKEMPLGTSGAINHFREFLQGEPFFLIYGDNLTNLNLSRMIKLHKQKKALVTIYLYHEKISDENTTPGCVVLDKNNFVKEFIQNPTKEQQVHLEKIPNDKKFTNSGIYLIDPKILNYIPQGESFFEKNIFPLIIKKGLRIYGFTEECYIREVGQMSRYLKAKEEVESGAVKL